MQPLVDRHDAQQAERRVAERLHRHQEQAVRGVEGDEVAGRQRSASPAARLLSRHSTWRRSPIEEITGKIDVKTVGDVLDRADREADPPLLRELLGPDAEARAARRRRPAAW